MRQGVADVPEQQEGRLLRFRVFAVVYLFAEGVDGRLATRRVIVGRQSAAFAFQSAERLPAEYRGAQVVAALEVLEGELALVLGQAL